MEGAAQSGGDAGCLNQYTQPDRIDMNTASGNLVAATFISAMQHAYTNGQGGTVAEISGYFRNNGGQRFSYNNIDFKHKGVTIKMSSFTLDFGNNNIQWSGPNIDGVNNSINNALDCRDWQFGGWNGKDIDPEVNVNPQFSTKDPGFRY